MLGLPKEKWCPLIINKIKQDTKDMDNEGFINYYVQKCIFVNHVSEDIISFLGLKQNTDLFKVRQAIINF